MQPHKTSPSEELTSVKALRATREQAEIRTN